MRERYRSAESTGMCRHSISGMAEGRTDSRMERPE